MAMAPSAVLVVEDDPFQRELVVEYLTSHGMQVTGVGDGTAMRAAVAQAMPDIAVLDVGLPGEDGFSLARWLRARSPVLGIVMLTAASDTIDRVVGLESGADDYVVKPFEPRELLARVRAVLRRAGPAAEAPAVPAPTPAAPATPGKGGRRVRMGGAVLDLERRALVGPDGRDIPLAASEFDLLKLLAENPNRALHRDWLLETTAAGETDSFDRAIDLRIMRLRRKVERNPARPEAIRTVRGIGYMFVPVEG
jgi:two-component system phosphate regulon response regulator OmpR